VQNILVSLSLIWAFIFIKTSLLLDQVNYLFIYFYYCIGTKVLGTFDFLLNFYFLNFMGEVFAVDFLRSQKLVFNLFSFMEVYFLNSS